MPYPVKHFESSDEGAPVLNRTITGSLIQVLKACLIDGYNVKTVVSLAMDGAQGMATFSADPGYRVHQVILITGASNAAWNGEHRVTAIDGVTVHFTMDSSGPTESGAGIEMRAAPAGGWAMPLISGDNNRAVFRADTGTRTFWYLDDQRNAQGEDVPTTSTTSDWRFFRGVDNMPDIDTREGTWGEGLIWVGNSTQGNVIPYDIFADDRTVYLITHPVDTVGTYRTVHIFGDFPSRVPGDLYGALLVLGRYSTTTTTSGLNSSFWGNMSSTIGKKLSREYTGLRPDESFTVAGSSLSNTIGGDGFAYPNPASLELLVHRPLMIVEGGVFRGIVPGAAQPLHSKPVLSRTVLTVGGVMFKAITHSSTAVATPTEAQTFIDIDGPWHD